MSKCVIHVNSNLNVTGIRYLIDSCGDWNYENVFFKTIATHQREKLFKILGALRQKLYQTLCASAKSLEDMRMKSIVTGWNAVWLSSTRAIRTILIERNGVSSLQSISTIALQTISIGKNRVSRLWSIRSSPLLILLKSVAIALQKRTAANQRLPGTPEGHFDRSYFVNVVGVARRQIVVNFKDSSEACNLRLQNWRATKKLLNEKNWKICFSKINDAVYKVAIEGK